MKDREQIHSEAYRTLNELLNTYLVHRDLDKFMTLVTENACSIGTGICEIARGREEMRTLYAQEMSDLPDPMEYRISDYYEESFGKDVYCCFAKMKVVLDKDGVCIELNTRVTVMMVRQGGRLLCSQLHISTANIAQEDDEFYPATKVLGEELLFNNAVCGVAQYRLYDDGNVLMKRVNKEGMRILELTEEDIQSGVVFPLESVVCAEDLPSVREKASFSVGSSSEQMEYRAQGRKGKLTWVIGSASVLEKGIDENNKSFLLIQYIFLDIDAKKKAEVEIGKFSLEQALNDYRKDMEKTLKGSGLGFWHIREEEDGAPMVYLDEIAADAVGLPPDIPPEKAFAALSANIYPDDMENFQAYYRNIFEQGRDECIYRCYHPVRGLRYVRCSGWWDGTVRRGFHIDVTDEVEKEREYQEKLKKSNDALKEVYEAAIRANAVKTSFLSNMSHDIRTPMNAIIGFAGLALEKMEDREKVEDCLRKILSSGEHLLELLNEILDMSRIEAGKEDLDLQKTSISEILRGIMPLMQEQIRERKIDFSMDVHSITREYVYADTLKARQILLNILSNAIKFTPEGGRVSLRALQLESNEEDKGAYRFIVEDNGIGMKEDFIAHIYEPFEREKSSTLSGTTGTGLGMTITKKLVDMMGGSISIESSPGKGSKFTVDLKWRLWSVFEETAQEEKVDVSKLTGKQILLVEDNELNRELATELLESKGFTVDTACDGKEAIEILENAERNYYKVVLMDIQMPVMDGNEATRWIRKMDREDLRRIPIIAVTANAFAEDKAASIAAGMNGHLAKPFDINVVIRTIAKYMY